jgi:hypothetical protein
MMRHTSSTVSEQTAGLQEYGNGVVFVALGPTAIRGYKKGNPPTQDASRQKLDASIILSQFLVPRPVDVISRANTTRARQVVTL